MHREGEKGGLACSEQFSFIFWWQIRKNRNDHKNQNKRNLKKLLSVFACCSPACACLLIVLRVRLGEWVSESVCHSCAVNDRAACVSLFSVIICCCCCFFFVCVLVIKISVDWYENNESKANWKNKQTAHKKEARSTLPRTRNIPLDPRRFHQQLSPSPSLLSPSPLPGIFEKVNSQMRASTTPSRVWRLSMPL